MKSYLLPTVLLMGLSISFTAMATTVNRAKEDDSFTINRGNIFHISSEQTVSQVKGLKRVAQILVFKGKLVARVDSGAIYLLDEGSRPGKGHWIKLGADAEKIITDGVDLFALTSSRAFWSGREAKDIAVFDGAPGELMWTFTAVPVACGQNQICMSGAVPTSAGRQISF